MEGERNARQILSAGRCLAAALAQTDLKVMAALLRAAARYCEGASGQVETLAVLAMPNRTRR
jgi:hypothetical protein